MSEEKTETIYESENVEVKYGKSSGKGIEIRFGKNKSKIVKKIEALLPLISVIVFLVLGFCKGLWHPGWVVFLLIPIGEILLNMVNKKGKALIMSITIVICTAIFLVLGLVYGWWHPGWLVFLLIPVVSIIVD